MAGPWTAAEAEGSGSIRLRGPAGVEAFLSGIEGPLDRLRDRCQALRRLAANEDWAERTLWIEPGPDGPQVFAEHGRLDAVDVAWAQGMRSVFDAHQALGGKSPDVAFVLSLRPGAYGISRSRGVARRFDDPCNALEDTLRALVDQSRTIPSPIRSVIAEAGPAGTVALRGALEGLAVAGQGAGAAVEIVVPEEAALALAQDTDPPVVVGPDGVVFVNTRRQGPAKILADMVVAANAATGTGDVLVFEAGRRLKPAATMELSVIPAATAAVGGAPLSLDGGQLAMDERAVGSLLGGGAETRYRVEVTEPGALNIRSDGMTDVAAALEAPDGTVLATDDDGGGSYNFALRANVGPGVYTLSVRHCCLGGGDFGVTAALDPPASPGTDPE